MSSILKAVLANVRVLGNPKENNKHMTYIPAYIRNGEKVSQSVKFSVMGNSHRTDKTSIIQVQVWNQLADTVAKSLGIGREVTIYGRLDSYMGNLFNADGSQRLDNNGAPIQIRKTVVVVEDIHFGVESNKLINTEIQHGLRGPNWQQQGHPDQVAWANRNKQRQAVVWDMQAPTFGYARVSIPAGVTINTEVYQQNGVAAPAPVAPQTAPAGYAAPQAAPAGYATPAPVAPQAAPVNTTPAPMQQYYAANIAPPSPEVAAPMNNEAVPLF